MVHLCIQVSFKRSIGVHGFDEIASSATTSRTSHPPTPTPASPPQLPPHPPPRRLPSPDWRQRSPKSLQKQPTISMIGFTIFGSGQPAVLLRPSSYQFDHRIIHLSRPILRRAFATKEARHENKSEKRGSKTSSGNVYHCSLIFHLIRLLVIYPFAGSLPLVYDSSVLLIPPSQFYFPPMFRKTRLDIFGQHLFRERIRRVLDQYQHQSNSIEQALTISAMDGGHVL
jgi:hypothetical protein